MREHMSGLLWLFTNFSALTTFYGGLPKTVVLCHVEYWHYEQSHLQHRPTTEDMHVIFHCFVRLSELFQRKKITVTFKLPWKPKDILNFQILLNPQVKYAEMAEKTFTPVISWGIVVASYYVVFVVRDAGARALSLQFKFCMKCNKTSYDNALDLTTSDHLAE